jgi:hypothetical protein
MMIEFNKNNKNFLILSDNKRDYFIAIPPGKNRCDYITFEKSDSGYNYNMDSIIIITSEKTRSVFYRGELMTSIDYV